MYQVNLSLPEPTVIDPRIEYPKWTRNSKKKRICITELINICMLEGAKLMYEKIANRDIKTDG